MDLCPFCRLPEEPPGALVAVALDRFPVSPGHSLIVTRRHVATLLEATEAELAAMVQLARRVMKDLQESHAAAGFNVGWNVGAAGGQTVPHLHLHVIPRYAGDCADPRGGIRHCVPGKGFYDPGGSTP